MKPFAEVWKLIRENERQKKQYKMDMNSLSRRVLDHLKGLGLIENDEDIEGLALRNLAVNYQGDVGLELKKVEDVKDALDSAVSKMQRERDSLKRIIDRVSDAELEIQKLSDENARLFEMCVVERDR